MRFDGIRSRQSLIKSHSPVPATEAAARGCELVGDDPRRGQGEQREPERALVHALAEHVHARAKSMALEVQGPA